MKNRLILGLALALLPTLSLTQAQDVCVQVIQPAVSPNGVCQEFANPCIVPNDWKSVPSCDVIYTEERTSTSLERKMDDRILKMRAFWDMKKAEQEEKAEENTATNRNFSRFGSGSLTRSRQTTQRLPTSNGESTQGVRAFTEKDFSSDVAKRYSRRGGYEREGETTSAERKERRAATAPKFSRSDANRTGDLKSTVRWDVLSRQFTTERNYGANPFTIRSKYIAEQKAKRDASNQAIDVQERMQSRQRVYRGERKDGVLSNQDLLDLQDSRTSEE
jgi:hypothetical protein